MEDLKEHRAKVFWVMQNKRKENLNTTVKVSDFVKGHVGSQSTLQKRQRTFTVVESSRPAADFKFINRDTFRKGPNKKSDNTLRGHQWRTDQQQQRERGRWGWRGQQDQEEEPAKKLEKQRVLFSV